MMTARSSSKKRTETTNKENNGPIESVGDSVKSAEAIIDNPEATLQLSKMTDCELEKAFNCTKCHIKLKDVKLLKVHYWQVHITENELKSANNKLFASSASMNNIKERLADEAKKSDGSAKTKKSQSSVLHFLTADSSTPNRKRNRQSTSNETDVGALRDEGSKAKKKATSSDDDESSISSSVTSKVPTQKQDRESNSPTQGTESIEEKLNLLTDEEVKYFNLSEDIDEANLAERAGVLNDKSKMKMSKIQELKNHKTVWACWYCHSRRSSVMWPAKIEKIAKDSSGKSKVFVKYFELNPKVANVFKMDPSKVEPFFKPVKEHFQFKELVTIHKPQRLEFFTCYTNALREFVLELEEREKAQPPSATNTDATSTTSSSLDMPANQPAIKEKYNIMGKTYTLDQIKELAHQPFSDATMEINRQRIAQSEKLFEALSSKACEDYLISIFSGDAKSKRHETYMKADATTRRTQLKFSAPGPLIVSHQESLAKMLEELSAKHYQNKPMHLKNYEYDVLYPESVIWALQKVDSLSYKKAETKYKMGFKRTEEEIIKSKCNEILNKFMRHEDTSEMNSTMETSIADQSVPVKPASSQETESAQPSEKAAINELGDETGTSQEPEAAATNQATE